MLSRLSPCVRVCAAATTSAAARGARGRVPAREFFSRAQSDSTSTYSKRYIGAALAGGSLFLVLYALNDRKKALSEPSPVTLPDASTPTTPTPTTPTATTTHGKERVVVLGSGWAALEFVNSIDTDLYDVVVVSPRNYFLYTPLLPSATVGTLELRSITEPIRKFCVRSKSHIHFYEAACIDVDPAANQITCEDTSDVRGAVSRFTLAYDKLVVAVGAVNVTMGVKGVHEHCQFLKEAPDASKIRDRLMDCFESSNMPGQPNDERRRLLHFVVVGGGPTGVEFAAELHDFVREDLKKYFPDVVPDVRITLVQSAEHILNTYDAKIQQYAEKQFARDAIDVRLNARVIEVREKEIVVMDKKTKKEEVLPFGMCVWSAGVGPNPLTLKLAAKIEAQTNKRALVTDEYLKIKGTPNIYAIGDCSTVTQKKLMEKFVEIFRKADVNGDGVLSIREFEDLVNVHIKSYPQLESYVNGMTAIFQEFDKDGSGTLDLGEFKAMLTKVDQNMKALPTTAQCAAQEGTYLGKAFVQAHKGQHVDEFKYKHFGSFAYVGGDRAVADIPGTVQSGGWGVWWLWRATYFTKQMSLRNRVYVAWDWTKAFLFGRDVSRI